MTRNKLRSKSSNYVRNEIAHSFFSRIAVFSLWIAVTAFMNCFRSAARSATSKSPPVHACWRSRIWLANSFPLLWVVAYFFSTTRSNE